MDGLNIRLQHVWALSDLHGRYELAVKMIEEVLRFNPSHDMLIVVGDIIDGHKDTKRLVDYLRELRANHPDKVKLLLGNHEALALRTYYELHIADMVSTQSNPLEWLMYYGGVETIKSYGSDLDSCFAELIPFIESLDLYYMTKRYLFVHAGVPVGTEDIRDVPLYDLLWNTDLNYDGKRTLIVGHSIVPQVMKKGKIVFINTGKVLSALDVLSGKVRSISE